MLITIPWVNATYNTMGKFIGWMSFSIQINIASHEIDSPFAGAYYDDEM